jgi:hypothetical protein
MSVFYVTEAMEVIHCAECAITFAIPSRFDKDRRNDHEKFYCPAGHVNIYKGESEAEKMRRERDVYAQRVAQRDDEIKKQRNMREAAERKAAAARGQVTKIKRRVGNGVCPCCNRTFSNLATHMLMMHSDYSKEAAE